MKHLRRAIELNDDNRVYAHNDGDFEGLRVRGDFQTLVSSSSPDSGGAG